MRVAKGLTQDELSKQLNISRSTIGMYEKGAREPDFETLEFNCGLFQCRYDYLLGRTVKTTYIPSSALRKGVSINVLGRVAAGFPLMPLKK